MKKLRTITILKKQQQQHQDKQTKLTNNKQAKQNGAAFNME